MDTSKKRILILIIIILNIFAIFYVASEILSDTKANQEKNLYLEKAREYVKEDLYFAALKYYDAVLNDDDTLAIREEMIPLYQKAIDNGEIIDSLGDVNDFIKETMDVYYNQPEAYEFCYQYYKDYDNTNGMVSVLENAKSYKVTSTKIQTYENELKYKYELQNSYYLSVVGPCQNTYQVGTGQKYGIVDELSKFIVDADYQFIAPFEENYSLIKDDERTYLGDQEGNRWKYMPTEVVSGTAISSDLMSAFDGQKYQYYNLSGEKVIGSYKYAGKFLDGYAAVNDGSVWYIIDVNGKKVSSDYEDIKLTTLGECRANGISIVKKNSKYILLDSNLKEVSGFSCDDADIVNGMTYFAYENNGKWGFANMDGSVVIEPSFQGARAYMNGYAGVKTEQGWNFIDETKKVVIQGGFEDTMYFTTQNTCFVKREGTWTLLKMVYTP